MLNSITLPYIHYTFTMIIACISRDEQYIILYYIYYTFTIIIACISHAEQYISLHYIQYTFTMIMDLYFTFCLNKITIMSELRYVLVKP